MEAADLAELLARRLARVVVLVKRHVFPVEGRNLREGEDGAEESDECEAHGDQVERQKERGGVEKRSVKCG